MILHSAAKMVNRRYQQMTGTMAFRPMIGKVEGIMCSLRLSDKWNAPVTGGGFLPSGEVSGYAIIYF
jgi:hypothetical protein